MLHTQKGMYFVEATEVHVHDVIASTTMVIAFSAPLRGALNSVKTALPLQKGSTRAPFHKAI